MSPGRPRSIAGTPCSCEKLRGGFALQRTGSGEQPQWLLIKRRDAFAQPGSDVVAELPHSVVSGLLLDDISG